jgi:hypothetical protein
MPSRFQDGLQHLIQIIIINGRWLAMPSRFQDGLQQAYPVLTTSRMPDFIKNDLEITCVWSPQ